MWNQLKKGISTDWRRSRKLTIKWNYCVVHTLASESVHEESARGNSSINGNQLDGKEVIPVWVRMWRFSKLGRSKALPQTSHGNNARSLLCGRLDFGVDLRTIAASIESPALLAPEDCRDSPDIDLCSSSEGGEIGRRTRDSSDRDRSSGEPIINSIMAM
jgi:hypothetical protein